MTRVPASAGRGLSIQRHQTGFTLIELLFTLAVAGILLAIATPALTNLIRSTQLDTLMRSLLADLAFARSEAITRAHPVALCPSIDAQTCSAPPTPWEQGRILFSDTNGDGLRAPNENLLRTTPPLPLGITLRTGGNYVAGLRYLPLGHTRGSGLGNDTFRLCDSRGKDAALAIRINTGGRPRIERTTSLCP